MKQFNTVAVIAALGAVVSNAAEAELYKCKDASGAITYRDAPCLPTEQRQQPTAGELAASPRRNSSTPKSGEPGLWETVVTARLRASHPKENAWFQSAPRQELEKAGDYKYLLGVPMRLRECTAKSPIEEQLQRWRGQCERQIKAGGGSCEASSLELGASHEIIAWITGDYRSELHIKDRVMQGKDDNGKDVYDDAQINIRYLGPCRADMKPGDRYLVNEDGRPIKKW
jgi:hypothetical protein